MGDTSLNGAGHLAAHPTEHAVPPESYLPYKIDRLGQSVVKISAGQEQIYYDNSRLVLSLSRPDAPESGGLLPIIDGTTDSPFPDSRFRKHISRLTINLTQACNLRCSYCYAEYGRYGQELSNADEDSVVQLVVETLRYYRRIDLIQLFGGEPLLVPGKIRAVCEAFVEAQKAGLIDALPRFAVVTNGWYLERPDVIRLLKQYSIAATVSCDGPPEITDRLRPQAGGGDSGSVTDAVIRGVRAAKAAGISIAIESTYTRVHQELGISVSDIIDFVSDSLSSPSAHVSPASYSPWGDFRPEPMQAAREFFEVTHRSARRICRAETGILEATLDILGKLSTQEPARGYCPAFTSQLSIDVKGDAYPCFMSMSRQESRLGSLLNDSWPTAGSAAVFQRYRDEMSSGPFGTRHATWYDSLISGCAAADYLISNSYGLDADAVVHEAMICGALLGYGTQYTQSGG